MKNDFSIDADIRRAATLSARFYTDESFFELSKERIFARSWQFAGSISGIENVRPLTVLEGLLDEPLLLTKDGAGKINCLSNVCTHRGKILVEENCRAEGLRCGYHGRRFDLEGNFLSMPEFELAENFPSEKDDLPKIPCEIWEDFVFVSLAPFAPLEDFTGAVAEILAGFDFANLRLAATKDYEVKAHWALYCENYLEGFHIPFVHKGLNEAIDYGSYETRTFRYASLQIGKQTAANGDSKKPFDKNIAAYYFFIFPNLMLNFYPWGISVNIVKPLRKDLTKVSYLTYINDETQTVKGAGADLETVEFEDQAVVESVQKGIESRFYDRGRYSPTREQGTHHFHRLIAEFITAGGRS